MNFLKEKDLPSLRLVEYVSKSKKKSEDTMDPWKEYTAALVRWKLAFELWQKAGNEALIKYNQAVNSTGTNSELPKRMAKAWEKSWREYGEKEIMRFGKEWQNMLKESGIQSIHKFNKDWQKFWTTPSMDASKTYLEAMRQFIETWQSMLKK